MPTRLIAIDGGPDIVLDRASALLLVGRDAVCDARLTSRCVSRRHCCLSEVDGAVVVRDLGSRNGTRINGLRVEWGHLGPGDELSIAHYRFLVQGTPEGPAESA
jgi:pSer/pThr/pTyr-binding forkhead associated (FHA) protein